MERYKLIEKLGYLKGVLRGLKCKPNCLSFARLLETDYSEDVLPDPGTKAELLQIVADVEEFLMEVFDAEEP